MYAALVRERLDLSPRDAELVLAACGDAARETLARKGELWFPGLGVVRLGWLRPKRAANPLGGTVGGKWVCRTAFKPSRELLGRMRDMAAERNRED